MYRCVWIFLHFLILSCKIISISIILRTCGLEIFVLCATGCIYQFFKCIRDICDSVKCLYDVMPCFSLGLFRLSLTGLTGQRDRSDQSKPCGVLASVDRSDRSEATTLFYA